MLRALGFKGAYRSRSGGVHLGTGGPRRHYDRGLFDLAAEAAWGSLELGARVERSILDLLRRRGILLAAGGPGPIRLHPHLYWAVLALSPPPGARIEQAPSSSRQRAESEGGAAPEPRRRSLGMPSMSLLRPAFSWGRPPLWRMLQQAARDRAQTDAWAGFWEQWVLINWTIDMLAHRGAVPGGDEARDVLCLVRALPLLKRWRDSPGYAELAERLPGDASADRTSPSARPDWEQQIPELFDTPLNRGA